MNRLWIIDITLRSLAIALASPRCGPMLGPKRCTRCDQMDAYLRKSAPSCFRARNAHRRDLLRAGANSVLHPVAADQARLRAREGEGGLSPITRAHEAPGGGKKCVAEPVAGIPHAHFRARTSGTLGKFQGSKSFELQGMRDGPSSVPGGSTGRFPARVHATIGKVSA